mgnify:CR=1 FL=1
MQEILQRAVGDDSEFVKILDTAEIRKQGNTTDEIENELLDIYVKKNYVINNNAQYGWRKNML